MERVRPNSNREQQIKIAGGREIQRDRELCVTCRAHPDPSRHGEGAAEHPIRVKLLDNGDGLTSSFGGAIDDFLILPRSTEGGAFCSAARAIRLESGS